jgi:hypothetical protein
MGKIICSLEEWDSILNFYRPNGSSKTWYIKELKRISRPLMWGDWDIFSEDGEMFSADFFKGKVCPPIYHDNIEYKSIDKIENNNHIYIINIFNMSFFRDNYDIGFKCISKKYLDDVRNGKSKILLFLTYEGYSGSKGNDDFEIIEKWREESNLPPYSVYYACGNLLGKEINKNKELKINVEPILDFEAWNKFNYEQVRNYQPINNNNLFLIYNRNPRPHRVKFLIELLKNNLFNRGLMSLGNVNMYDPEIYLIPDQDSKHFNYLRDNSPLHINSVGDLHYNLACNITTEDYDRTFISIISETLMCENSLFITEKTWKPIMVGHPFIILGNKGTLKYLKSIGYKTFDKWINEDYDDDIDEIIRINKITDILKMFSEKSTEELLNIREEMKEVCEHNQQNFKILYDIKYGKNNINESISSLIENVWESIKYKSFNLVYDKWNGEIPVPNGSIYYDNKYAFNDGISLLNHCVLHTKKENFKIKKYKLEDINDYENFFYIINHYIRPTFLIKDEEDFVITNEIIEKLKTYKNFKIILITEHEPIDENDFLSIINYFNKKNIDLSQVYCVNNNSNLDLYKTKFNSNINVYKINFLLFCKIRDMRDAGGCEFITKKEGKFFMTFNKSLKPHRTAILCLLMKYNLIDDVNWSFIPTNDEKIHSDFMKDVINDNEDIVNIFNDLQNINYKLSDYENNLFTFNQNDNNEKRNLSQKLTEVEIVDTYINSYVNITTESVYNRLPNTVHISEKSFKPFFYYQFPIFVASKGHIKQMKEEYGLDFFDDVINHSYDDESDHKKRLIMILDEIKRLNNMKDYLIDFYGKNRDRFENNKKIIINLMNYIEKDYSFFENLI